MERFLLLDSSAFPQKFSEIDLTLSPAELLSTTKTAEVEKQIINALNTSNSSLRIQNIIYDDISAEFTGVFTGKYSGLIVEDHQIKYSEVADYQSPNEFTYEKDGEYFVRVIFGYVFLSPTRETSRNILVSQAIYPELLQYMEKYLSSPSYTIANKPIYFLNIINKNITASMPLKHFSGLVAMEINYIGVFNNSLSSLAVPEHVEEFLRKYYSEYMKNVSGNEICDTPYFLADLTNKTFKVQTTKLVVGESLTLTKAKFLSFHGSDEKFYLIDMLPSTMFACREGYQMDLSNFKQFCDNKGTQRFKENNQKLLRFRTVLKYLQKLIECRR